MSCLHTMEIPERISRTIVSDVLTRLILSGGDLNAALLDNALTPTNPDSIEEIETISYLVATLFVVWTHYRIRLARDNVYVSGFEIKDNDNGFILGLKLDG